MSSIILNGLPQLRFAHVFGSPAYHNTLPVMEQCIEISYISQGSLQCTQNGRTLQINAGDVLGNLFLSPLHTAADRYHEHRTVCFSVPFYSVPETAQNALFLPLLAAESTRARHCRQLIDEIILCHTAQPDSGMKCAGLFLQLLAEITELNCHPDQPQADGSCRHVRKAKEYIFAHLNEPIRQQEVAAQLGITPEHLCTVFRRHEGVALMTFVNRIKLERIHTLIHREKLPLYRAAELFGYSDPNYVSRLYRKLFGISITRDDSTVNSP